MQIPLISRFSKILQWFIVVVLISAVSNLKPEWSFNEKQNDENLRVVFYPGDTDASHAIVKNEFNIICTDGILHLNFPWEQVLPRAP